MCIIKKFLITFLFSGILTVLLLCGCDTAGYVKKNLQTTNGMDGWICTFDSLDGDYTNAFPINSNTVRITSRIETGTMNIVLSANGVTKTFDGADMDEFIPVKDFGDGNLFITLDAQDAGNGRVRVIWTKGDDPDDSDVETETDKQENKN